MDERTREIPLTRGMVALVDAADYDLAAPLCSWHAIEGTRSWYARGNLRDESGTYRTRYLHSVLTGWPMVDHINGDGLDNRRANLRPATRSQNAQNRPGNADSRSGMKGVSWHKSKEKWRATIRVQKRSIHLGYFADIEGAARAYDVAALHHFGSFARLNFTTAPEQEDAYDQEGRMLARWPDSMPTSAGGWG